MEDMEYLAVCQKILLPIAEEFQPDFVSVSA
jgi:acetoin utilization deacetylase AcuC-like enzyme